MAGCSWIRSCEFHYKIDKKEYVRVVELEMKVGFLV